MQFYKKTKALGSDFEVYLQSDEARNFEADYDEVMDMVTDFEKSFSRFLPESELCRLNNSDGNFLVSSEMINILKEAQRFYKITDGIFNPTILESLEKLGYEKSFSSFDDNLNLENNINFDEVKAVDFLDVKIDEEKNLITKDKRIKLDLGGIGKGYVADKMVEMIKKKGYSDFWISAGGDMFISGNKEDGQAHVVGVQNPLQLDEELFNLYQNKKPVAIATSGRGKRKWKVGDKTYHHIVDPRTGMSADNELLSVTIIADNVVAADVFAKVVFILGAKKGIEFIDKQENVEGLAIDKELTISLSKNMNNYLKEKYEQIK